MNDIVDHLEEGAQWNTQQAQNEHESKLKAQSIEPEMLQVDKN